ncbi:MAG: 2-amino-4-hydroxy-6-hydroxymethyldihydropteridine diphosphokinase [Candidatus Lumbricidophila eiseniae]|uniref:2-amino-4-hydroxy-6-hydroxymethyldihydropteridine diphosphokinase n=1 Tax=Candidatus Lumbricidiphila eiseniae TaxID=1969409 RepID=A0A2A6FS09_9MICO|nr:MAG: 2-amino-4-hydroxy-6-hydroxymethyldihydropteridine diphosphokinase [Candidatus Lumbricidophila eiseniae]
MSPTEMVRAVVAFGTNLGDRDATITSALRAVADAPQVELIGISPIYQTPALTLEGIDADAPPYLNGVVTVRTTLSADALLDLLHRVETDHGRQRSTRWASRTLDLDLIDFDGQQRTDVRLSLPHPRAWQRAFVLQPWLDLEPGATLVGYGSVATLRAAATDSVVRVGAVV